MSKLTNKLWKEQQDFYKDFRDNKLKLEWGGFDKNGYDELEKLVLKVAHKGMQIIEVGSWIGTVSVLLGTIAKKYKGHLYCVDHFRGSENSNLVSAKYINILELFKDNLKTNKLDYTIFYPEDIYKNIECRIQHKLFDFIFIDADHRYEYIKEDIKIYLPLVKKEGILAGHDCEYLIKDYGELFKQTKEIDYTQCHTGVIRAVMEELPEAKLTEKGYIWWVKK